MQNRIDVLKNAIWYGGISGSVAGHLLSLLTVNVFLMPELQDQLGINPDDAVLGLTIASIFMSIVMFYQYGMNRIRSH